MRILGVVQYKGSNYQGWQKQVNFSTIQNEIETRLSTIFNKEINIFGSGRTDAGVHALGQTFHFDVEKDFDLEKLKYSINRMLPNDIKILSFTLVDDDFHARFSAKSKTYLYKIWLDQKEPFEKDLKYVYSFPFDYDLFVKSIKAFQGKHDFKDLTAKEEDEDNFIREIYDVKVEKHEKEIHIEFTGNGFMRYQIRNMVGVALAVASNHEDFDYIVKHLDSKKERDIVNYKAPSEGLYLVKVNY